MVRSLPVRAQGEPGRKSVQSALDMSERVGQCSEVCQAGDFMRLISQRKFRCGKRAWSEDRRASFYHPWKGPATVCPTVHLKDVVGEGVHEACRSLLNGHVSNGHCIHQSWGQPRRHRSGPQVLGSFIQEPIVS